VAGLGSLDFGHDGRRLRRMVTAAESFQRVWALGQPGKVVAQVWRDRHGRQAGVLLLRRAPLTRSMPPS
jgi:hypothetical protein